VPVETKEVGIGTSFERSSNQGQSADSQVRVFRTLLSHPGEIVDVQAEAGVRIGDKHPYNNIYCTNFQARYDGDGRMVVLSTFQYGVTPGSDGSQDPKEQPPDIRPANWTTRTSLIEEPVRRWFRRTSQTAWAAISPAQNPAGDFYDGVTKPVPVVNISITQFEPTDPTNKIDWSGYVNDQVIVLGNLTMQPGTVMYMGPVYDPVVEYWRDQLYRGWKVVHELVYKKNVEKVRIDGADVEIDIGWDIAVPQSGWNVRAFNPNAANADQDEFGVPLRHGDEGSIYDGRIIPPDGGGLMLPEDIAVGERCRAMVKVFSYKGEGASQAPSASPVPLNNDGTPRKTHDDNGNLINEPIVYAYRRSPTANLKQILDLRVN
jgi:hypothetical protein